MNEPTTGFMEIDFWVILWKCVLVTCVSGYGLLAIWVTVQGARDIKSLFASLRRQHEANPNDGNT